MQKFPKILIGIAVMLAVFILAGPRAEGIDSRAAVDHIPAAPDSLEQFISLKERSANLKPDNHARIIWNNPATRQKTEYALVYLHGFSASQGEGDPIHEEFARRYGMNAYLARIAGHGLDTPEPFHDLTASGMVESAAEALLIGKQLGEKIILMSCSTGGTLSLYLAASYPDDVHSLILYSPNVDVYDKQAWVLTMPWGLQVARVVTGSDFREWAPPQAARQYWYAKYRLEGAAAMKKMVNETMTAENFERIKQPMLLLYYFKDENERDFVVSIDRMKEMFDQVSTPESQKQAFAMPETGNHVLCSKFFSKDLDGVRTRTYAFTEGILGIQPAQLMDH